MALMISANETPAFRRPVFAADDPQPIERYGGEASQDAKGIVAKTLGESPLTRTRARTGGGGWRVQSSRFKVQGTKDSTEESILISPCVLAF
jgi:hypothetical protein